MVYHMCTSLINSPEPHTEWLFGVILLHVLENDYDFVHKEYLSLRGNNTKRIFAGLDFRKQRDKLCWSKTRYSNSDNQDVLFLA